MKGRDHLAAMALIVLSMLRIGSTWTIFSATVDEPMHISAGLQLYKERVYSYQVENPPLPRIVLALAPRLGGMEFERDGPVDKQLRQVFYSRGRYKTNLVLARAGNLLFFVIASAAVWLWARREMGATGGFLAMLLFTTQPAIVAHAGVATHDMAATAGVAVSLLAFARWMDSVVTSPSSALRAPSPRKRGEGQRSPSPREAGRGWREAPGEGRVTLDMTTAAITFGAAYGLAVLCKFSAMGYVPAACLAMYVVRVIRDDQTRHAWRGILPAFVTAAVTTVIVIASGYAFAIHYFFAGIRGLRALDGMAHFAFLFGDVSPRGWWYYFPAALALKTTLASLLLVLCSIVARRTGVAGESLAAAAAILAVSMTSHLNLGVRYILPIFAPLAVAAAAGAAAMLRQRHVLRAAGIALLAWHTGASALAHPDTLAYFNELAGPRPWRCLLDSNLDWGQDVLRLKRVVREKQIDRIGLAIMGWHDYDALGFPPHYEVRREVPSQGWIAVSEHLYGVARRAPWLDGRRWERVGKSIRLYYVP